MKFENMSDRELADFIARNVALQQPEAYSSLVCYAVAELDRRINCS